MTENFQATESLEPTLNAPPVRTEGKKIEDLPKEIQEKHRQLLAEAKNAKESKRQIESELNAYREALSKLKIGATSAADVGAEIERLLQDQREQAQREQDFRDAIARAEAQAELGYRQQLEELKKANEQLRIAAEQNAREKNLQLKFLASHGQDFGNFKALLERNFTPIYGEDGDLLEIKKLDGTPIFTASDDVKPATVEQVFLEMRKGTFGQIWETLFVPYNSSKNANIPAGISSSGTLSPHKIPVVRGMRVIGPDEVKAILEDRAT